MPAPTQIVPYPFGAGLASKHDVRARPAPALDVCTDVQFDELGGVQERLPYDAVLGGGAILGGGTLANCRRVVANGSELVVFTDTGVYSWASDLGKWVSRGTHLAISTTETPACVSPGDQVDGDRAELNGVVIYAWTEATTTYAAALSKTTGAVLVSPTALSGTATRPRVIALATKILLSWVDGANNLKAIAIDPASPGTAIAGAATTILAGVANAFYDAEKNPTSDSAIFAVRRTVTTSYSVLQVTSGLSVSASTPARVCDGPIAVAIDPTGAKIQIARANGTNIQGDLLNVIGLGDVFTGQALGTATSTTINQVTVAFTGSTAWAFWTSGTVGETTGVTDFTVKFNTVTTSNVVGTQAVFRHQLGIASRAFAYSGHVYVWLAFGSDSGTSAHGNTATTRAQLQNTYLLYRDDVVVCARAVPSVGGGFAASTGRLPGVALVSGSTGFAWCATSRRRIEVGGQDHSAYAARSPRDIGFTFDSNDARRGVRIGATLYFTGSIPMQYDGVQIAEVGWLIYPWYFEPSAGGVGLMAAGTYTWLSTMRWTNAQGEVDRSTTATGMSLTVGAAQFVFLTFNNLYTTLKTGQRPPAIDMWRSQANAGADAPFYLITSQDPNAGVGANGYAKNDDTSVAGTPMSDNFADATLVTKEIYHETGSTLEHLAPPGATVIAATDSRIFLGGVAGDPDTVWYSRLRGDGEVVSFHDALTIPVPQPGGLITAFGFLNDTLVVFRERAIYVFGGEGYDNTGGGQNYGPSRLVSSDVGATSSDAVAFTPAGLLFRSSKGWYTLGQGWDVSYVGGPVAQFDSETVLSMQLVETQHQVRILTASRMIVWDYLAKQWGTWSISDGVHACNWQGHHVYLTASGPRVQATSFSSKGYGYDVETAWIKPMDLQGGIRTRWFGVLGEYRGPHLVRVRVARDYRYSAPGSPIYDQDEVIDATAIGAAVGSALQARIVPRVSLGEAIKVRLTGVAELNRAIFDLATASSPVTTSGTAWAAQFLALAPAYGEIGNGRTLSVAFDAITSGTFAIDVRDHFVWSSSLQRWREQLNAVAVRVRLRAGSTPTVAQLEAAIVAGTKLINITSNDPTPSKTVSAAMAGSTITVTSAGGAFTSPPGEAAKLTGLSLQMSIDPNLYRRLAAAQKG